MHDEVKEYLAKEFADVMRNVRETKWAAFSDAADQASVDPYIALGVLLVRIVESTLARPDPSQN